MHNPTNTPQELESFTDLPIQPTGSGVQDLEIAYEQMRLSEDEAGTTTATAAGAAVPTPGGDALAESEAHPS